MFDMLCAQPVTGGERTRWDTDEFLERVREAEGYFMPDRTLGGKGRLPPQDCRCPTKEAKTDWRKRTCGRKAVMQQAAAASSFQVGIDTETGKAYTFFDSAEDFFKQTTYMVQRNFYEIVRTDQWCRLYFDVEHYTMTPKTNVTVEKILDIIEEVLRKRWPKIFEDQASVLTDRAITVASRWVNRDSSRVYKHSYRVVYPRILFEGNKGEMKELAEKIAQHPGVRAAGKKGETHTHQRV
jgi:hypothetical protein